MELQTQTLCLRFYEVKRACVISAAVIYQLNDEMIGRNVITGRCDVHPSTLLAF